MTEILPMSLFLSESEKAHQGSLLTNVTEVYICCFCTTARRPAEPDMAFAAVKVFEPVTTSGIPVSDELEGRKIRKCYFCGNWLFECPYCRIRTSGMERDGEIVCNICGGNPQVPEKT